jgi:hypothetical protein
MRALAWALLVMMTPLAAQRSVPSRGEISAMERSFDQRLQRFSIDTPMELLGMTRGLYLTGFGAVFTAEVNLVQTPGISPFRPTISKEDIARIKAAKVKRLPELKTMMREMMLTSAGSLDRLPLDEQMVLGVSLFYNSWEESAGMPRMITMQAPKRALMDVATNRMARTSLDSIIQTREEQ